MRKENCLKRKGIFCVADEKRCNKLRLIVPNSKKAECIDKKAGMSCFERVAARDTPAPNVAVHSACCKTIPHHTKKLAPQAYLNL